MRRSLVWDLVGVLLVSFYGTEVCPILEDAGVAAISPVALGAFLVGDLVLGELSGERGVLGRVAAGSAEGRTQRIYLVTLLRHLLVGAVLGVWDLHLLGVPIHNVLKVVLGTLVLGHFVGVDLALAHERRVLERAGQDGQCETSVPEARSLVRRLVVFASVSVLAVVVVVTFMVLRDVDVLARATDARAASTRQAVTSELAVAGVIVTLLVLNLIVSFSRNVTLLFANQTRVLAAVGRGELDATVPVLTHDEFGVIAAHTNQMIVGLRERRKVRDALGKIVSPEVARRLLDDASGLALGGTRRTLTLLFSDIRGFTSWSEGTEPEVLVADLNRYFTEMVRIVHEEGGVVDKFIGDGLMAVFGLGGEKDASESAARAARRMIETVEKLGPSLTRPLKIGVGVHRGDVVAGNIGSPDRLEYTFIGDTVNTAARIESLTGKIGAPALVSEAVLADLPAEERARWTSRGAHELKGKSAALEVYGLAAA